MEFVEGLVSVIVPAYNAEAFIAESIKSVQQQTYESWELIIIDDGSTDCTRSVVEEIAKNDARIKYIYQENGRQGKARNNGIRNASGKYIAFLDADDLWLSRKLEAQVGYLDNNPSIDLVYSDSFIFKESPLTGKENAMHVDGGVYSGLDGLKAFLQKNRIPILTAVVKKAVIEIIGGFSENSKVQNAEDYFLWCEMLINGSSFYGMADTLTAYRKHEQSVTASSAGSAIKQVIEVQSLLVKKYPHVAVIVYPFLKKQILASLSVIGKEADAQYFSSVKRVLQLSNGHILLPVHALLNLLGWRRLDFRMTYFFINRMHA